jgi:hypothetical protein
LCFNLGIIRSIEECVNGKCLPKTEFEWEESDVSNTSDENDVNNGCGNTKLLLSCQPLPVFK